VSAIPLLRVELERFADRYRLTAREHDVVYLLVTGYSTVPLIAERLGLSQNTVHNHFKNVFRRTHTNTKAGLLSLFISEAMGKQARVQPLVRQPRVLVLEPDSGERGRVIEALRARGLIAVVASDAAAVLESIASSRVDLVIAPAALRVDDQSLLDTIAQRHGRHPRVILTAEPSDDVAALREQGAADVFQRPISADRLTFAVIEQFVDSPYERNRLRRVEAELPANLNRSVDARIGNLGFGGAFVAVNDESLSVPANFRVGSRVELEFVLDDREPISVQGDVMWRRSVSRPAAEAGIGVSFVGVMDVPRSMVDDFVRRSKLRSFFRDSLPARVYSPPRAR
jgi:DNA-binding NarL/FixJ family response regulator